MMDTLRQEHKIRHIGLSNVTVHHLKRALEVGVPITWVQVEMHPYFYDKALLDFCLAHGIFVQAWRPLDLGRIKDDSLLASIGKRFRVTEDVGLGFCDEFDLAYAECWPK